MESGNNPQAKSPKNALGLWQFIPSTAREWGLTSSKSFDDRKNVIKSTQTAIKYLNYLLGLMLGKKIDAKFIPPEVIFESILQKHIHTTKPFRVTKFISRNSLVAQKPMMSYQRE